MLQRAAPSAHAAAHHQGHAHEPPATLSLLCTKNVADAQALREEHEADAAAAIKAFSKAAKDTKAAAMRAAEGAQPSTVAMAVLVDAPSLSKAVLTLGAPPMLGSAAG